VCVRTSLPTHTFKLRRQSTVQIRTTAPSDPTTKIRPQRDRHDNDHRQDQEREKRTLPSTGGHQCSTQYNVIVMAIQMLLGSRFCDCSHFNRDRSVQKPTIGEDTLPALLRIRCSKPTRDRNQGHLGLPLRWGAHIYCLFQLIRTN